MTDRDTSSAEENLLPIGKTAELLGVTVGTVREWERLGKVSALRTPGGHRRFRHGDVESLLTKPDAA